MNKEAIINSIKKLRENSKKRNFSQSFDIVINLQGINIKSDQKPDLFVTLPHTKGKKIKICALVGNELASQAKSLFDKVILNEEFPKYSDKKSIKKLADEYDYFIAQASLMSQIALVFGKVLGPRNKMPNPKAGLVVTPATNLNALKEKLERMVHLVVKTEPCIKTSFGTELMNDNDLAENVGAIYSNLTSILPQEKQNIKSVLIKTTMSQPVKITEKGPEFKEEQNNKDLTK